MTAHEIRTERIDVDGVGLQVTVAGPDDAPLVVLVHGFPELAYSWRHQITGLAAAGYRVVAPDMRGYGASDRPEAIEAYDIFQLVGDVVGLIRHYGAPATVVGHDWGAMVAWATAQFRPDLLRGVVGVSVPYGPSLEVSLLDLIRMSVGPDGFHYILYFQEPGVAEAELDADPIGTMRRVLWMASAEGMELIEADPSAAPTSSFLGERPAPSGLPTWLSDGDFEAYGRAFTSTGFTGGLNWYRNLQRNWELSRPWRHTPITVPAAFIGGRQDPVISRTGDLDGNHPMLDLQAQYCPDLTVTLIEGAGHWTQQEKPDETNAALVEFLDRIHS
ncbi:MAG: alpha/beta fold hydrolase [Acidimicrobiales bacterium]